MLVILLATYLKDPFLVSSSTPRSIPTKKPSHTAGAALATISLSASPFFIPTTMHYATCQGSKKKEEEDGKKRD